MSELKKRPKRYYIRGRLTKRLIVKTVRELFANEGYFKTSIIMVSERAQIGYGTFYSHFKCKDDVLKYMVDEVIDGVFRNYAQAVELNSPADAYRLYYDFTLNMLSEISEDRAVFDAYKEAIGISEDIAVHYTEIMQRITEWITETLKAAEKSNAIYDCDINLYSRTLSAIYEHYLLDFKSGAEAGEEAVSDVVANVIVKALYK